MVNQEGLILIVIMRGLGRKIGRNGGPVQWNAGHKNKKTRSSA